MFPQPTPNQNLAHRNAVVQGSSALVPVDLNANGVDSHDDDVQNVGFQQAESIIRHSQEFQLSDDGFTNPPHTYKYLQKLQDDLQSLGTQIKQHEDNLNRLNIERSKLDDGILKLQVTLGKSELSCFPKIDNGANPLSVEEVNKQILKHEKTAAGVWCLIKTRHETMVSQLPWTKDAVGIVAMLGQVDDDNLSRLFSEYLGVETMLAIVCKTYEGVKALELYGNDGSINKSSGLHGLSASIGRAFDDRFQVICLESLRSYPGKLVVDDPQRKLDILNPRLPNGQCPSGFLGFAVNMIKIDSSHLFCVTPSGHGLRETLFYNLFSRIQVYKTRAEMIHALPCISDGALSLDGGIVRGCGVLYLGNREDVDVRFPRLERSMEFNKHLEMEMKMKNLILKKEKIMEDFKREQTYLDVVKFNFVKKKSEFIAFLAQSSSAGTQVQTTPDRHTPR